VIANDSADAQHFVPSDRNDHWRFDLPAYCEDASGESGSARAFPSSRMHLRAGGHFFSFRRATHRGETDYGRQLSAIMLAPDESVYRGGIALLEVARGSPKFHKRSGSAL